ncbi:glucose dehydrogenase [FAD, quinone]-like [Chironomus tepperi]|uniref:glucose dehydrogenase [FAD, quinone]-like n=1 Tax=Chironomus tepperi TaxID=113505 RepID=UPI00391EEECD
MENFLRFLLIFMIGLRIEGFFLRGSLINRLTKHVNIFSDIISFNLRLFQENVEPPRYLTKYDFIIVGSGPGGCALANRLTENKNWNVLMIEAGHVETLLQNIPLFAAVNQRSEYDWAFRPEPQTQACQGMNNNQCFFPRGKGVGGSSIINYMIYNRGHDNDFDRWEQAGNPGWSFDDVEKFFKKSEAKTLGDLKKLLKQVNVEYNPYKTKLAHTFLDGHKELGFDEIQYNLHSRPGVSYLQASTLDGFRHTGFRAYIKDILHRPNFHIMVNTQVTKILINPQTKTAYGVEYQRFGRRQKILARKEVILSSGTFNSAKLLILSGVGNKQELKKLGIPLIQELEVGKQIRDHYAYYGITFVFNSTGNSVSIVSTFRPENLQSYVEGQGRISLPGSGEALSFIQTSVNERGGDVPDAEFFELSGGFHTDFGMAAAALNMKQEIYDTVYKPLELAVYDAMTLCTITFHPKSIGYIELKDRNPFSYPIIYPNMLSHPDDVQTIFESIKFALSLLETEAFRKLGARVHPIPLPGCTHLHFGSDAYWHCTIHSLTSTIHHQTTSCKMGSRDDKFAVVNHELKVHGINRLRVVDTSIIPEPTSGHPNAVSFMIGEKAADMIKNEWIKK